MRPAESPTLVDWLVVSLRWLALLSVSIVIASRDRFSLAVSALLFSAAIWNTILVTLPGLRREMRAYRALGVAGDAVFAVILFALSGGISSGTGWIGLLPLLSAALYFGFTGALLATLTNLLVQGGIAFLTSAGTDNIFLFLAVLAILYLATGGLLGYVYKRYISKGEPAQAYRSLQEKTREETQPNPLYGIITTLSSTLNYQRVLETAIEMSFSNVPGANGSSAERMVSAALLFTGDNAAELEVRTARRFTPADMRTTIPGETGLVAQAIDGAEAAISQDISSDPELTRYVALQTCTSAYCIPLRTGRDICGVLLFAHPERDFFISKRRQVLDVIGNQAMIALQNARLYQDLEIEKERMLEIQEDARKKMARDLHDGPTQSVAAIAMRVNFARRLLERDPKATAEELFKIEEMARRTTKEIRHMLFTLRPLVLESQGLIGALEAMAEKTRETYDQLVIIQADPTLMEELEISKQGVMFSIAEEAVANARKHAQAPHIWVRLKRVEWEFALLEIDDDGLGFDLAAVDTNYENRGSLGMVNMRERAALVNGILNIDSAIGKGTRIQVIIPLTEKAVDRIRRGL